MKARHPMMQSALYNGHPPHWRSNRHHLALADSVVQQEFDLDVGEWSRFETRAFWDRGCDRIGSEFEDIPTILIERESTTEALLDTMNRMIDRLFPLQLGFLRKNS